MKVKLVLDDWRRSGKSIYQTARGVELSMGDLHSGSTIMADVELPKEIAQEIKQGILRDGSYPVFALIVAE